MQDTRQPLWTKNFTIFFLSSFFMALGVQFLNPTLPVFAVHALGVGESQVGFLLGGYSLSALVIRPFSGYAFDFLDRKKTYIIALAFFTLVCILYPFAMSFIALIVIRILHGLCFGVTSTGSGAIVADVLPEERRGEGIGYFGLTRTLSKALGPAIALYIMGNDRFLQMFLAAGLLIGIAFLLANNIMLPPIPKPERSLSWKSLLDKRVYLISFMNMLMSAVNGGIMSYIVIFSEGIGIVNGGLYFFVNSIGIAAARLFAGKIFDRSGPRYVVSLGCLIYTSGLIVLSISNGPLVFAAAGLIIGLGNGVVMPTLQTMVLNIVEPENRGIASSTFYALTDIGVGGGAIILGLITKLIAIRNMFLFSGLYLLLPLLVFNLFVIKDYNHKLAYIRRLSNVHADKSSKTVK